MKKSRVLPVMALATLIGASTACTDMTPQQQGTMTGVAIGTVTGAGIIALAGGSAWTGAAVGAVAGGIAGNIKGRREQ